MLVELIDGYGDQTWINPKYVVRVCNGGDYTYIETVSRKHEALVVIGTPAEVAAKLNGAEVAK